ncbi:ATP-binding protein [Gemmatimonas groenlandica]|uniref:histidine kinase n=1 Tax=Gemmatimonas groenlandica TaxID=2732249 RepID=A0A6M4IKK0_9BACT|nr:ATP-binding protein [Gemmatimonas groenlandica]QJR34047.1 response regulator [Gemmatimonas groenlandica]
MSSRPDREVGVAVDIAERQLMESRLRQTQKMEAMGRLAGGIAHDFNNLLTVIGSSAMFLQQCLPPEMYAALDDARQIEVAVERAALLTRQLLRFSREQLPLSELVVIDALVENTEPLLRRLVGSHIEVAALAGAPGVGVLADQGQLVQVLLNLAANARDAMPEGGVLTLETAIRAVDGAMADRMQLPRAGEYVELSVSDTGMGMDDATLARAFDAFYTTKAAERGTGLGLATVRSIVTGMHGAVTAVSRKGIGSIFKALLPAQSGRISADTGTPSPVRGQGETIVVVEDEGYARVALSRMLTHLGYVVLSARHGRDAVRIWEDAGGPAGRVDLVVTDVVMPELTGPALADELRARHPHQALLFVTGYTGREMDEAHDHRDIRTLSKPLSVGTLSQAVRREIRRMNAAA